MNGTYSEGLFWCSARVCIQKAGNSYGVWHKESEIHLDDRGKPRCNFTNQYVRNVSRHKDSSGIRRSVYKVIRKITCPTRDMPAELVEIGRNSKFIFLRCTGCQKQIRLRNEICQQIHS